jgi:hypothetical protein
LDSPVIVHGLAVQSLEVSAVPSPVGVAVMVYPVMVAPPLELGTLKATVAVASPAEAEVIVGVVGGIAAIEKVTSFVPDS